MIPSTPSYWKCTFVRGGGGGVVGSSALDMDVRAYLTRAVEPEKEGPHDCSLEIC